VSRAEAVVDLAAIRANVERLRAGTNADVMAVVKADGYGHGLVPSARAALAGGASWLGVAVFEEALALRAAGITVPILSWLWVPDETDALGAALAADVDVSVGSGATLAAVAAAVQQSGRPARVHLKIDTGLSRGGAYVDQWPALVVAARELEAAGQIRVVGIWSHLVWADSPDHPTTARQLTNFAEALEIAEQAGLQPDVRHLANSAATVSLPAAHYDLVRPGVAVYGLSPIPESGDFGLVPAMTLRAQIALTKRVRAGEGVSYGHAYTTERETTLALVPLGYADGIPRSATNIGPLAIDGRRYLISGRVCMDQFVVDVGDAPVVAGDQAVLFGPGRDGEPRAQDWASALGTIHYEIVTRIGARVPRVYVGST
jgi:alanine racemase